MRKVLTNQIIKVVIISLFSNITFFHTALAQSYEKDNFVIRLAEGIPVTLRGGADGRYEYGITSMDNLNDEFDVIGLEKIFIYSVLP